MLESCENILQNRSIHWIITPHVHANFSFNTLKILIIIIITGRFIYGISSSVLKLNNIIQQFSQSGSFRCVISMRVAKLLLFDFDSLIYSWYILFLYQVVPL